MKVLVVVDMQNDFIDGKLGTKEAVAIVPKVVEKIKNFEGRVFYTRDTHEDNYMETQEGINLPVPHCLECTTGWELAPAIAELVDSEPIDKTTFGSVQLGMLLEALDEEDIVESITFVGLCTDICVISNALIAKAFLPEVPIIVDASCCAGVTPESHENALNAMAACQIKILR